MGSGDVEEAMPGPSGREEERILVSVRMRPLNEKEALRNEVADWECINNTTVVYKNHLSPERSLYPTSYTFDRVFGPDCSTRKVYEEGAKAVVLSVVGGINSSVFAYGQTSSGKTFTMSGITECTMEDIFNHIHEHKEREFHLKFSAMEIYNESVRDLLTSDNTPLRLLDDPERGTVVEKLTEATLRDRDHFKELIAVCQAQRQIGETFLNEVSSRSHQILRLTIESSTREFLAANNASTLTATLNLVDLAGSERASQALSAGSRLKEGSHINRSLLTLGTVIRKLSKGGVGHIPYRDSKLTRILQPSLGGNARTAVICTMSPARTYAEQSRNTLLFATRAKEVITNAHVNVVMSDKALVKHLQRELARLENELRSTNPSVKADATDLLREKDLKIEELEGRVRELTSQLDHALSQLHDSQQQEEKDSSYPVSQVSQEEKDSSYPVLQVQNHSQEEKETSYPVLPVRNHAQEEKDSSYPVLQARNHLQEEKDTSYPVLPVRNHSQEEKDTSYPVLPVRNHSQDEKDFSYPVMQARNYLQEEKDTSYPLLQVRLASENASSDTTTTADQQSFDPNSPTCQTPQSPERHSSSSYDESYSISDFEESLPPSSPSEEMFTEPSSVASSPLLIPTPKTAGHKSDSYEVPKGLGNQTANLLQVDPYAVLEENGDQSLNSYEIGTLQVSEPFQMPVQQTSHRDGAQSPYFVEFDPYELPDEIGDETIDYSEVYMIQNSGENTRRIPEYDNIDPYPTAKTAGKQTDEPLEEFCKEVQCINSDMISNTQANSLQHGGEKLSLLMGHGSDSCGDNQPIEENTWCSDEGPTKEAVLGGENSSSEDPRVMSDKQHKEEVTGFSEIDHNGYRSSQSNDISSGSSSFSETVKYEMQNESEDGLKQVIVRLDDAKKKQISDANNEVPKTFAGMTEFDGLPVKDIEISDQMGDTISYTRVTETKEMADLQHLKLLPSHQGDDMMQEACKSIKTMKDVGLNPQDDLNASSHWPFDSITQLQMEIFELWESCNESLVHRTQFFLLFIKGDHTDTIYMEVERRRLSYIQDAFSTGNSVVLDGQKLTPDSSKRSLQSEREMLAKLIRKRLSKQERINLYAKWHVNLASKRRSLQLAHHLWVNKTDMDHITESANIVAKLIRFSEPQVPKEAFGLNLMTNWRRKKSYR